MVYILILKGALLAIGSAILLAVLSRHFKALRTIDFYRN